MTGIERLRALADNINRCHSVWSLTIEEYDEKHGLDIEHKGGQLRDLLAEIADQIERERNVSDREEHDAAVWVRDHGGLDYVMMEWDRRSNLKRTCEKLRSKVGRQQRHIEFVQGKCRERQGHIVDLNKMVEEMRPRLMPEGCEWPTIDGRKVDFKTPYQPSLGVLEAVSIYSNGACEVMSHDGIIKPVSEIHAVVLAADGEPLEVGQTVYGVDDGIERKVYEIDLSKVTSIAVDKIYGGYVYRRPERLTHQRLVLDADGEEIRVGDEVWSTKGEFDGKRTVSSVYIDPGEPPYAMFEERQKPYSCLCFCLTHRAPVLASDGKPLREGETVYHVNTGSEYSVRSVTNGGAHLSKGDKPGGYCRADYLTHQRPVLDADGVSIREGDTVYHVDTGSEFTVHHETGDPNNVPLKWDEGGEVKLGSCAAASLTHTKPEPPDSWERIEDDATLSPEVYCHRNGIDISQKDGTEIFLADTVEPMARDLVRRCRALAERERGE